MAYNNPTTAIPRPDLAGPLMLHNPVAMGLVVPLLFPVMMVDKDIDNFDRIGAAALSKLVNTKRADGTSAKRIEWSLENDSYATVGYAVEDALPDPKRAKRSNIDWDAIEADVVGGILLRDYERLGAAIVNSTSNWAASGNTGKTVSTKWDVAGATPAADISAGVNYLCQANGVRAEDLTLVVSGYTARNLAFVTDVRQRLQIQTQPFAGQVPANMLAHYFGIGEVLVAQAMYNSADDGQTASLASIWNEDRAFLCVRDKTRSPDLRRPMLGRTFVWPGPYPALAEMMSAAGDLGSGYGGVPMAIDVRRDEDRSSDVFRASTHFHIKHFATQFGYLIDDVKT